MAKRTIENNINNNLEFIGLDPGFSNIKYATNGDYGKFISAIAEIKGLNTEAGDDIYKLDGRFYYVGEKALKQPSANIIDINSYDNLERFTPMFIVHTLNILGIEPENVGGICLGLSPSHLSHLQSFKERCSNFILNDREYSFNIKIIPQGMGATVALEDRGLVVDNDLLLIDGGFNTVDTIFLYDKQLQKGRLSPDNAFENMGVIKVAEKLARRIKESENIDLTIKETQQCLTTHRLKHRGSIYDLSTVIADCVREYTKELMDFITKRYGGDMDKMDAVYIVGGLAYMIDKEIEGYAENFIKTFEDSEYLNAIGNYLYISNKGGV